MPARKLKRGQVWGNVQYRRTILQMWDGMVAFSDGRTNDNYPVSEKSFRRWITASASSILDIFDTEKTAKTLLDTIEVATDGYWLIVRLQLGMRAAVKHLERRDNDLALGVLERQLERLEIRKTTMAEAAHYAEQPNV